MKFNRCSGGCGSLTQYVFEGRPCCIRCEIEIAAIRFRNKVPKYRPAEPKDEACIHDTEEWREARECRP